MKKLDKSIIQRVKDELDISDDLSSTELYDLLHKYRSSQHPDNFIDSDKQKEAEEKFKSLSSLLQELASFIEKEKLQKKPSEIIPYEKDFELVKTKQTNVRLEEEIENLKLTIRVNEYKIKELKKELVKLRSDKLDEKTKNLIELYKPSKKNLFALGITFFLTFIIGVLSRIDEIATLMSKYSPLDKTIFNYIVFIILVLIPIKYLKMIYEESRIQKLAKKIKTPLFIHKFSEFLEEKNDKDKFVEMDVFNFLHAQFFPKNVFRRFFFTKVFNLYNEITIDSMKDIFIYNLFNKQLIEISSAENLSRSFSIIKKFRYADLDENEFDEE